MPDEIDEPSRVGWEALLKFSMIWVGLSGGIFLASLTMTSGGAIAEAASLFTFLLLVAPLSACGAIAGALASVRIAEDLSLSELRSRAVIAAAAAVLSTLLGV